MKNIYLVAFIAIFTLSCNNEKKETEEKEDEIEFVIPELPLEEKIAKTEKEASRLRGGGLIKTVELNADSVVITYVKNYSEYKKLNPKSKLSKSDLDSYWNTGDAIEKALVDGSVRMMKKLDFLNNVEIILPYKGKTFSIKVTKEKLEWYIGNKFVMVEVDWNKYFSDPYVYNDEGREKFFKQFGTIK